MNDVAVQGISDIFEDLPTEEIKLLISMITKQIDFDLMKAIDAGLAIAKWGIAAFTKDDNDFSVASTPGDAALASALSCLLPAEEGAVSAQGVFDFPKQMLIEMIIKWVFTWINSKINP